MSLIDRVVESCRNATFRIGQYSDMDDCETLLMRAIAIQDGDLSRAENLGDISVCPMNHGIEEAEELCADEVWNKYHDDPLKHTHNWEDNRALCNECWKRALGLI